MKKSTFTVVALKGAALICVGKDALKVVVHPKLGQHPQVGDTIKAYQMQSLQAKVYGGRSTQWVDSTATGAMFWKQSI